MKNVLEMFTKNNYNVIDGPTEVVSFQVPAQLTAIFLEASTVTSRQGELLYSSALVIAR